MLNLLKKWPIIHNTGQDLRCAPDRVKVLSPHHWQGLLRPNRLWAQNCTASWHSRTAACILTACRVRYEGFDAHWKHSGQWLSGPLSLIALPSSFIAQLAANACRSRLWNKGVGSDGAKAVCGLGWPSVSQFHPLPTLRQRHESALTALLHLVGRLKGMQSYPQWFGICSQC